LVANMRRQSPSARSTKACWLTPPTPALAKQPSTRPKASRVLANACSMAARFVTSQVRASAGAPSSESSASASWFFCSLRPQIETAQPARARAFAMPRPMPPLPPVMIATRPFKSKSLAIGLLLHSLSRRCPCAPRSRRRIPQAFGGRFRREIALRRAQHLEPDHEFLHRRRAQEGRVEMSVHLPFGMHRAAARLLMEAHRIGERHVEQPVVAPGQLGQRRGERLLLGRAHLVKTPDPPPRQDHRLERPDRRERDEDDEMRVGEHDPLAERELLLEIVDQQDPAVVKEIFGLAMRLLLEFVRKVARRPDLAVRMWVGAAHDLATVLED